jgi:Tol biopolymer transport system component/DNA-binding winged helix-turn-helix (wHTH) protein
VQGLVSSMRMAQFGVFEVDAVEQELRKSGTLIRLQQQPFQVLALLVERAGEVVTREELRDKVWGGKTFVEFDQSVNSAIKKIRVALCDPATNPRFIETLPRRGYRFIAPVRRIEALADSALPDAPILEPAQNPATPLPRRQLDPRVWRVAGLAFVTILGLSTLGWMLVQPRRHTAPVSLNPLPLTTYPGSEIHPSFSPDGKQIAFSWNGDKQDNYDIYIKLLSAEKPLRLTQDPARDVSPAWSPDGQRIAFVRHLPGQPAGIFVVPALGGAAREFGKLHLSALRAPGFQDAVSADPGPYLCWSKDGQFLAVGGRPSTTEPFGLFALSVETGKLQRLTTSTLRDTQPSLSPDGRTLAFVRAIGVGVSEIHLLPVAEDMKPIAAVRRLTFENRSIQGPAWSPNGDSILFSLGPMVGSRHLWRTPVSGRAKPELLPLPTSTVSSPTVASGARRMAYSQETVDYNIWSIELPAKNGAVGQPRLLIASTYTEKQPQFSPDGKRIAFGSSRSGTEEIWVADADGSNAVQLTRFGGPATGSPRWSPDGRQIAFDAFREGLGEIFVVPSAGGAAKQLTRDHHRNSQPSWSQDGQWIYFTSLRSGRPEIWKMPAPGTALGPAIQVTQNRGLNAFELGDGKFVYYVRGGDLWRIPVDGGAEMKVIGRIEGGGSYALAKDGIYFFMKKHPGDETTLQFLPFPGGQTRRIASIGKRTVYHLAVSPDSRSIVYLQRDHDGADVLMVENFK